MSPMSALRSHRKVIAPGVPALLASVALILLLAAATNLQAQWRASVAVEERVFKDATIETGASRYETALIFNGAFFHVWDGGYQSLAIEPFVRLDIDPGGNNRVDLREASWQYRRARWQVGIGMREVYWGVAESRQLVDVINQRELVVAGPGYVKLGQAMVNVATDQKWGRFDVFLLPWFRERSYAGRARLLWSSLPIDTDNAEYGPGAGKRSLDWAARWTHSLRDWDVGLSHFSGTNREPRFLLGQDPSGVPVLVPRYEVVGQTSLDLQWTTRGWLWKLEAMTSDPETGRYTAVAGGFEYAFTDYFSIFAEYMFDSRGEMATTSFADDVFAGARLLMQEGMIQASAFVDRKTGNSVLSLAAGRRVGNIASLGLEAQAFLGSSSSEPAFAPRQHTYLALSVSHFF